MMPSSWLVHRLVSLLLLAPLVRARANTTPWPSGSVELNQGCRVQDGGFVTCLCVRLSPSGSMTVADAGYLPPYCNGEEMSVEPGLPMGVASDAEYTQTSLRLDPGDTLTFLSDGVVEAQSEDGELFGFDRTAAIVTQSAETIAAAVQAFGQEDDITVLTLKFAGAEVAHA